MSELVRFGVSINQELLENFDRLINERNYATRSEALRDMIRDELIQQKIEMQPDIHALGSLTLVYDHHARNLSQEMGEVQHKHHGIIISVMHLHVSNDDCMEIIDLRGLVADIV